MIAIIVARSLNNVIGANGDMPWGRALKADLAQFKKLTTGHAVIMGRKTHESIGRALPERQNIVLSRDESYSAPGCQVASSLEAALAQVDDGLNSFVIGGASIYQDALPHATVIFETLVRASFDGDVILPSFDPNEWICDCDLIHPADEHNQYPYSFRHYRRRRPA